MKWINQKTPNSISDLVGDNVNVCIYPLRSKVVHSYKSQEEFNPDHGHQGYANSNESGRSQTPTLFGPSVYSYLVFHYRNKNFKNISARKNLRVRHRRLYLSNGLKGTERESLDGQVFIGTSLGVESGGGVSVHWYGIHAPTRRDQSREPRDFTPWLHSLQLHIGPTHIRFASRIGWNCISSSKISRVSQARKWSVGNK